MGHFPICDSFPGSKEMLFGFVKENAEISLQSREFSRLFIKLNNYRLPSSVNNIA